MLVIFNGVIVTGAACPRALWQDKLRKFMAWYADGNVGREFNRNLTRVDARAHRVWFTPLPMRASNEVGIAEMRLRFGKSCDFALTRGNRAC